MITTRTCARGGMPLADDIAGAHCLKCLLGLAPRVGDLGQDVILADVENGSIRAGGMSTRTNLERQWTRQHFGDYELLGEIAHGGMGVIYHAMKNAFHALEENSFGRAPRVRG